MAPFFAAMIWLQGEKMAMRFFLVPHASLQYDCTVEMNDKCQLNPSKL